MDPRARPMNWIILHILVPTSPALLAVIIRLFATQKWYWEAFSASDFALCAGLLSLFVRYSLLRELREERPLDSEEKRYDIRIKAMMYLLIAFCFALLFALVVAFGAVVDVKHIDELKGALHSFQVIVFIGWFFLLRTALLTQRAYNLKAGII